MVDTFNAAADPRALTCRSPWRIPIGAVEAFVLIATRVLAVLATSPVMSLKNVPLQARLVWDCSPP